MGEVYRARDTRLDRMVAIKVLNSALSATPDLKARFEREAKAISQLNHPNICVLHDIGSDIPTSVNGARLVAESQKVDFLVMEFLDGESLADRIASKGALPVAELVRIGCQIADALDKAHRAGIVHRDLKPGNIMLTRTGAKLLDFGLAIAAAISAASTPAVPTESAAAAPPTRKRRRFSAETRARMAEAQRKRYAAANKVNEAVPTKPPAKKCKMSAAGRKRIIEATKKRWAEYKAKKAAS